MAPELRPALRPVAELVRDGYRNYQIAHQIYCSVSNVENMVRELYDLLGVEGGNRVLLAYAIQDYFEQEKLFG